MVGLFEASVTSSEEQRLANNEMKARLAAAVYDVRTRHGAWLFGASDLDGFDDRAKLAFTSICKTIEPHLHARRGVYERVLKDLKREWRQRQACYPGCEKNEAHAAKFHKDKAEKDASRRQAEITEQSGDHPNMHTQVTFKDHQGEELIPEGKFRPEYLDSVDQGAPQKVERDFVDGGGKVRRHDEDGGDNFVPTVTGRRRSAGEEKGQGGNPDNRAQDNRWREEYERENGSDYYASREYQHLARLLYADDLTGNDPNAQMGGGPLGTAGAASTPAGGVGDPSMMGGGAPAPVAPPANAQGAAPAAGPVSMASREYRAMRQMLAEMPGGPAPAATPGTAAYPGGATPPGTGAWNKGDDFTLNNIENGGGGSWATSPAAPHEAGRNWALRQIQDCGTRVARKRLLNVAYERGLFSPVDYKRITGMIQYRTADRNYLQQADEAITKVLNEKAEEFQNTIAPLQQALITIQQAEQLQNPLNVQPPAGTVNVLPQGGATDPNAAAGGAPDPNAGQAPQGAGGLGADPAAAALAGGQPPPQQVQASWYNYPRTQPRQARRGRHPLADRRQAAQGDKPWGPLEGPLDSPFRGTPLEEHVDLSDPREFDYDTYAERAHNDPSRKYGPELGPYHPGTDIPQDLVTDQSLRHYDDRSRSHAMDEARRTSSQRQADVDSNWNQWSQNHTNRGDDSTYEQFAQEKGYAAPDNPRARAIPSLQGGGTSGITTTPSGGTNRGLPKKPKGAPTPTATKPIKPVKGGPGYGISASRRRAEAEPGYAWSKSPATVKSEYLARVGSGVTPEQAYRQMIAEITDHHERGMIGSHDAHRAANEAFGRLLLSRRGRRPLASGG